MWSYLEVMPLIIRLDEVMSVMRLVALYKEERSLSFTNFLEERIREMPPPDLLVFLMYVHIFSSLFITKHLLFSN